MANEHTNANDSRVEFTTTNYSVTTTPETEWWFVAEPHMKIEWPVEKMLSDSADRSGHMRKPLPIAKLDESIIVINFRLEKVGEKAMFLLVEGFGARLYTGPMCASSPAHGPPQLPPQVHKRAHTQGAHQLQFPADLQVCQVQ
jgi:hypothetical protein